jgi:subtilisin family serine protease
LQATADDARCNSFTLAQALTAALDAKAQVVNLSISGPADPLLSELITQGVRRGLIYVGAAPRDGSPNSFPVSNAGVIAVDAAGLHSGFHDALAAPGTDILTLTPTGTGYDFSSGASLATAHVTGTVALLLHQDHKLNAQSVLALLQRSRDTNSDASINACTALAAVTVHASCKPTVRAAASAGNR